MRGVLTKNAVERWCADTFGTIQELSVEAVQKPRLERWTGVQNRLDTRSAAACLERWSGAKIGLERSALT